MADAVTGEREGPSGACFEIDVVDRGPESSRLRAAGVLDRRGADMLEALLIAQQDSGVYHVRVDLSGVAAIDSAGLIALLNAHQRFLAARGTLVLTGVRPPLRSVLDSVQPDRAPLLVDSLTMAGESACTPAGPAAS